VIENWTKQFIEANCKTLGSLASPQSYLEGGVAEKVEGLKFDIEVIEAMNRNQEYMKAEEKGIVISSLKGIYEGSKQLLLNYG